MDFTIFEQKIRESIPMLIESYVLQYGECNREHITRNLERLQLGFYVTPDGLLRYTRNQSHLDRIDAIFDTLKDLDIDFKDLKVVRHRHSLCLETPNEDLQALVNKMLVRAFGRPASDEELEKIEKRPSSYDLILPRIFYLLEHNINKRSSVDYQRIREYAFELEEKIDELTKSYYHDFFERYASFLTDEEKEQIKNNPNFPYQDLESFSFWFRRKGKKGFTIDPSIKYFNDYYSKKLRMPQVDPRYKELIVKRRFAYLEKNPNFQQEELEHLLYPYDIDKLFCDWEDIPYLKQFFPNPYIMSSIEEECKMWNRMYREHLWELLTSKTISKDLFDINADSLLNFNVHSWTAVDWNSPLKGNYVWFRVLDFDPYFDAIIDHELRHVVERYGDDVQSYKCGVNIGKSREFVTYNELVTQKLALEATRRRWNEGKMIFSSEYASHYDFFKTSSYDDDIWKLDIVFNPFKVELTAAQMSPKLDDVYEIIPKPYLVRVEECLTKRNDESVNELYSIRSDLIARNEERRRQKIKLPTTNK